MYISTNNTLVYRVWGVKLPPSLKTYSLSGLGVLLYRLGEIHS